MFRFVERSVDPKSPNMEGLAGSEVDEIEDVKDEGSDCCPGWSWGIEGCCCCCCCWNDDCPRVLCVNGCC